MMGPLEYLVIGFDGDRISPEIVRELDEVRKAGTVRMLDLMIIAKDPDGGVSYAAGVRPVGGRRPGARDGRRRPGRRAHQLRLALRGRHGFGRRHHAGLLVGDRDALRARVGRAGSGPPSSTAAGSSSRRSASRQRPRPRWRRCSAARRSAAGHPPRMRCFSVANSASVSLPRSCRSASTWQLTRRGRRPPPAHPTWTGMGGLHRGSAGSPPRPAGRPGTATCRGTGARRSRPPRAPSSHPRGRGARTRRPGR